MRQVKLRAVLEGRPMKELVADYIRQGLHGSGCGLCRTMSFPRYPAYKPSGVEWLGEVPSEWKVTPLKSIACVINGFPFDSKA